MQLRASTVEARDGARIRVGGRWWLNFAATNYLGLNDHPRVRSAIVDAAADWGTSLGMPRALALDRLTAELEIRAAQLTGQQTALVFPSTSQAANDLIPYLSRDRGAVFLDEWAYPISVSAAQLAAHRGAQLLRFTHNNHRHLARLLATQSQARHKVVVCDGVYSAGGKPADLGAIVPVASAFDAVVYLDDAHGIGLLGERPTPTRPYGLGGRGTPGHFGVTSGKFVHVAGLSKAFGVPLAVVAGTTSQLRPVRGRSATFEHSSPPSPVLLAAALASLQVHAAHGEAIRRRLLFLIRQFRRRLPEFLTASTSILPIQSVYYRTPREAVATFHGLRQHGIWTVPQADPRDHPHGGVLRLVITARHRLAEIVEVVEVLSRLHHGTTSTGFNPVSFTRPRVVVV